MKYSLERKESVLRKLLVPDAKSVAQVSEQEGISHATLFNWRNTARNEGQLMPDSEELRISGRPKTSLGWCSKVRQ